MKKLYISNFFTGLVFWYGIEKLFLHAIHISNFGVTIDAIVFVIVSLLFNIPTGLLADKWNRKYTLMLGISALAVSTFVMAHSHTLPIYLCGTAILALYMTLTSGTFQAITYDLLAEDGKENEYVKHQGRSYGMFLVGVSLGSVVGGYIANKYGYRSTYLLSILPCIVNLILLATIREPIFHKETDDTKLWPHIKKTARLLTGERLLFYLSMLFIAASLLNSNQNEYAGLYFIALGFGAIGNGWANAGKWLAGSFGQFLSQKLGKHMRISIPAFSLRSWHLPFLDRLSVSSSFTSPPSLNQLCLLILRE